MILAVVLTFCRFFVSPAQAKYSGGTGEPNNPYRIATAANMNEIRIHSEDITAHFILVNDINLAEYTGTQFNIIEEFGGVFDGNDHIISNFTYESTGTDYIGLFGRIISDAEVKNMGLSEPNVNAGTGWYVGSLVGNLVHGVISNCYVCGGSVSGERHIGGLAGENEDVITNCYSTSTVSGNSSVGGLVGYNSGGAVCPFSPCWGKITDCYSTSTVSGNNSVGGLVGGNESTITNCDAVGMVAGSFDVGGLVGFDFFGIGTVTDSFWDVDSSGIDISDGGTGKTTLEMMQEATFINWDFVEIWNIGENQTYPYLRVYPAGDLNHNGIVNMPDFAIFAEHWLEGSFD